MVHENILGAFDNQKVVVDLDLKDGFVSVFVNCPPPERKAYRVSHQIIGGFYTTGAAISLLLSIDGVRIGEHIMNPNHGRQRTILTQFASQELVKVKFVVAGEVVKIVTIIHKVGIRNELAKMLQDTIANNGRVSTQNWPRTVEAFLSEPVNVLNS